LTARPGTLPPERLARTLVLSKVEGMAFATMVGLGEAYFVADAIRLGSTALQIALIVGLPLCVGALGPLMALRLLGRFRRRRALTAIAASGQALVLALLAVADRQHLASPALLILGVCIYQVCGQGAATCWNSWFGDIVPAGTRGSWFARRNRLVYALNFLGLVGAGLITQALEPAIGQETEHAGRGFFVIYLAAATARLGSVMLTLLSAEPAYRGLVKTTRVLRYLRTERGSDATRVLLLAAALYFMVYAGSPYFSPFMLRTLHFSYAEYMAATVAAILFKVAFLPLWGRGIDASGPRRMFRWAALLIAVVPLPWLWAGSLWWVVPAQALSGASWAGYEVAQFSLLLGVTYGGTRPQVFAAQSILNGAVQFLGGLVGAAIVGAAAGDLRVVFAVSLLGRLAIAGVLWRALPGPLPAPLRKPARLRPVGIRAHGGLVHRPVPEPAEEHLG